MHPDSTRDSAENIHIVIGNIWNVGHLDTFGPIVRPTAGPHRVFTSDIEVPEHRYIFCGHLNSGRQCQPKPTGRNSGYERKPTQLERVTGRQIGYGDTTGGCGPKQTRNALTVTKHGKGLLRCRSQRDRDRTGERVRAGPKQNRAIDGAELRDSRVPCGSVVGNTWASSKPFDGPCIPAVATS